MHLTRIRLSNFQCFGPSPTVIELDRLTYLLGPNGAGKTGVLTGLARMFAIDPQLRRLQRTDFHVATTEEPGVEPTVRTLWIEVDLTFPELVDAATALAGGPPDMTEPSASPSVDTASNGSTRRVAGSVSPGVPPFFSHMRINAAGEPPRVRIRMTGTLDETGEIDHKLVFVIDADEDDEPITTADLDRYERAAIQVHYLPARRDPAEHIAHTSNTLLGRLLRAIDWQSERTVVDELTGKLSDSLAGNAAITALGEHLAGTWHRLHRGTFFTTPEVSFTGSEIETLLRHLTITFDVAPADGPLEWTRLSDGQQSLLYLTMILALHDVGTRVLAGEVAVVDPAKLRPASFTLIALEEPENSLSPHYLGRVTRLLTEFAELPNAQAVIATHSPSVVRRVPPETIRHLRLNAARQTVVSRIELPAKTAEGYKFVREAVEAFPELYFARLVVLGEGDSEQVVLPRMLQAAGAVPDLVSISIVPLGGRHVNHFWRLLTSLDIPFVTLLDLDIARHRGGWGRVHYAREQLLQHRPELKAATGPGVKLTDPVPDWDTSDELILESDTGRVWLALLERYDVYFSAPLDLDFAMMSAYAEAYGTNEGKLTAPTSDVLTAVLGKARALEEQYSGEQQALFTEYHRMFNNGSKPVRHLGAMSELTDAQLAAAMPAPVSRLLTAIKTKLAGLPE